MAACVGPSWRPSDDPRRQGEIPAESQLAVNRLQVAGVIMLLLGLLILFVLRGPLYAFIVVVLKLIGILAGILLVVAGVALILGGKWARRIGRQGYRSTALMSGTSDT